MAGQLGAIEFHGLRVHFTTQWAAVFLRVFPGSTKVLYAPLFGPGWAFGWLARTEHMKSGLSACMFSVVARYGLMPLVGWTHTGR